MAAINLICCISKILTASFNIHQKYRIKKKMDNNPVYSVNSVKFFTHIKRY